MSTTNPKYNLRNPLPLSAAQESEVKQLYYKRVRSHCAPEIKAFAECAVNRTVTATWVCRKQRLAMNSCMVAHAKPEEEDRAREEWFLTHGERKKAKVEELEKVERRREEVIRMMREDERRKMEATAAGAAAEVKGSS
ncbi:cytochrome c oxidase biogenesis protein Cmc1 like-domain-containing protein [Aspergillus spectabilis]